MIHGYIIKGTFQDSVTLMALSRELSALAGVNRLSIMMGTPANLDVFKETGFWQQDLAVASPNDLCIAIDTDDEALAAGMAELVTRNLADRAKGQRGKGYPSVHSWRRARQLLPGANLALISVAGHHAFEPARQALEDGCHVLIFSDNVTLDQEIELKQLGRSRGLLVMGPDCGTAIVGRAPLAFANRVPAGPIAIIGASGTGIQELTSQIARMDGGITHALGLGSRDLSGPVGGISALQALECIRADPASQVVVFVSKPPAPAVRERVTGALKAMGKPAVALFLGEKPGRRIDGQVHFAATLDEAARQAVELARFVALAAGLPAVAGKAVLGLYTGGTLAAEAALLLAEALDLDDGGSHAGGRMLDGGGHRIFDLGDDLCTRGRPHPMIDPEQRNGMIRRLAEDASCGVLLLDIVLGLGSHPDPAGEAARAVAELRSSRANAPIVVIATVTGTTEDPQDLAGQVAKLEGAGIVVAESTRIAALLAAYLTTRIPARPSAPPEWLATAPSVINIGLRGFAEDLHACGIPVVHVQWEPAAGGDERLKRLLATLN